MLNYCVTEENGFDFPNSLMQSLAMNLLTYMQNENRPLIVIEVQDIDVICISRETILSVIGFQAKQGDIKPLFTGVCGYIL